MILKLGIPGGVSSLDALKELKGLTSLRLDLESSGVSSLDALRELKGLTSLVLSFGSTVGVSSLDALKELKGLTSLTLDVAGTSDISVPALKELKGLTSLTLSLTNSNVNDLSFLQNFDKLDSLDIHDEQRFKFNTPPKSLRKLKLSSEPLGSI